MKCFVAAIQGNVSGGAMAVKLYLASGEERVVDADGARLVGAFFEVTRRLAHLHSSYTVLTLRSQDVVRADIEKDGVVIEHVLGAGGIPGK